MQQIWSHANLPIRRKLKIYNALLVSKVMYSLDGMWLSECELKRLDSFHCTCIRRILKVAHSYYSRISNHTVLERATVKPLSRTLTIRQLKLFGRIATMDIHHQMRKFVFDPNHVYSKASCNHPRLRGRPRASWANDVFNIALRVAGSNQNLRDVLNQCSSYLLPWQRAINMYMATSDLD